MADLTLLLAFVAAASVLTITPGIDTAMVLRSAAAGGARPAVLASVGIALGCLAWGAAVSVGLGAVLHASELAYAVIKWVGAAYLMWLGIKLLLKPRATIGQDGGDAPSRGAGEAFWRGFLTNLLNPKVGVFYVTFLPQFVPDGANVVGYTFFLAFLHVGLTLGWFAVLIAATVPLGRFLRRPAAVKTLDRLTGAVFVAFGVKLAFSSAR